MPPPTPLLDGYPTFTANSPDSSYRPQVSMRLRMIRAWSASMSRSPVAGSTPRLDSTSAKWAMSSAVTYREHMRKYTSSVSPTSPSSILVAFR